MMAAKGDLKRAEEIELAEEMLTSTAETALLLTVSIRAIVGKVS